MTARTPTPARGHSLRTRVRTSIVSVTALAMLLFAIPLGVAVQHMDHSNAVTELQRDAVRVATVVPDTIATDGSAVSLPTDLPGDRTVGIYTIDGRLIRENGPATSALAAAAADGRTHVQVEGSDLAVSVPVPSDQAVAATVRVSVPNAPVTHRTWHAWTIMALLGALVIGIAALLARHQGRRIAEPLERLTVSARALGDGDFTIHPGRSGVVEADTLAGALEVTAQRLGTLLDRERAFSTQVSHQLRTPLTALLLGLESALSQADTDLRQAMTTAVRRGEKLETTIEDLLRLARDTGAGTRPPLAMPEILATLLDHWQPIFAEHARPFRVTYSPELPQVHASPTAIHHVLEVLIDNALVHGAGPTTVSAQAVGDDLLIEVSDRGPGLTDPEAAFTARTTGTGDTHGIGLGLARTLAEAEGGRLILRHAAPHPTFALLLRGS
ncbi:sensor histidine kinase [Nocardia yunnanensis]|uniref:histidine kinase n=1 Tax=Nocardia yunnanensis TaxID=2382165 RepID=A0A386ZCC7_9NOCA|nr:HAMP domain-containing sensor histidine kinase [Nocardia yunnanensis]AYF74149.1 sensor histidine kinase [Nocardia yunnanensis]